MSIKEKRLNLELSQFVLAQMLEVDRTTVGKWETGDSVPKPETAMKLCQILGCTLEELYESKKTDEKGA